MDERCWTFPRWPTWEQDSDDEDTIFAITNEVKGYIAGRAVPVNPMDLPWKMQHINDARGAIVSLTWKKASPLRQWSDSTDDLVHRENLWQPGGCDSGSVDVLHRPSQPEEGRGPCVGQGPTQGRSGSRWPPLSWGEKPHLRVPSATESTRDRSGRQGDGLEPVYRDA